MIHAEPKRVPLLCLDLDGTVRKGFEELGRFVNGPADVEVFPEAIARMRAWRAKGGRIIGVSNQGGVALGHVSFQAVAEAMLMTQQKTGNLFDRLTFCIHHPGAEDPELARCWCRKPSPGLVVEAAIRIAEQHRYAEIYPPALGLFVGDRPEDEQCAKLCGMDFQWAKAWRETPLPEPEATP